MLTRDDLSDIFGEENIIALDFDDAVGLGCSELDALLLSHVGLPSDAGAAFTTELDGEPGLFRVQMLDSPDGSTSAALFLGAPGQDQTMRYFLDVKNSVVVVCSLDDAGPAIEVVNGTFSDFVDFVHRIGAFCHTDGRSADEQALAAEELSRLLQERDTFAFRKPDTWWSRLLSTLTEQPGAERAGAEQEQQLA